MSVRDDYAPGVCNIGSDEIRRRRQSGWFGLAASAVLWIALILADAAPAWYLTIFLPAFAGASGFIQAASRFCYYFGFAAIFNFGQAGQHEQVTSPEAKRRDRTMAMRILGLSVLAAAIVTLIAYGSAAMFA